MENKAINFSAERNNTSGAAGAACQPAMRAVCEEGGITFGEAVELARQQIELDTFARPPMGRRCYEYRLAEALCRIIAEVMKMRPVGQIKISGEMLDAALVKEVFGEIRADHVQHVIEAIHSRGCGNACKKIYVRSMLYNSVFELECDEQAGIDDIFL